MYHMYRIIRLRSLDSISNKLIRVSREVIILGGNCWYKPQASINSRYFFCDFVWDFYSQLDSDLFSRIMRHTWHRICNRDSIEELLSNSELKSEYLIWEFQVTTISKWVAVFRIQSWVWIPQVNRAMCSRRYICNRYSIGENSHPDSSLEISTFETSLEWQLLWP